MMGIYNFESTEENRWLLYLDDRCIQVAAGARIGEQEQHGGDIRCRCKISGAMSGSR